VSLEHKLRAAIISALRSKVKVKGHQNLIAFMIHHIFLPRYV